MEKFKVKINKGQSFKKIRVAEIWFLRKKFLSLMQMINSRLTVNSLPNGKILDWSKLKEFTDGKINVKEN